MIKHAFASSLALSFLAAPAVHAAEKDALPRFYAGVATGQSKSTLENSAGERFSSKNHPLPVKLYGGVDLSDYFAVEAGFSGTTGKHEFDKGLYGTATEPRLQSRAFYMAAKGTVAVSEKVDLHAKLGVAHSRFEMSSAGAHDRKIDGTKPMFGVGAAYKFTEQLSGTLEFEHYGTVREQGYKMRQQQLQAGLKFSY